MKKNLIFIAGLGSTGSSAVCDLLSEYDGILCPKDEWRIWVDPDGLLDLLNNLSNESTIFTHNIALKRYYALVNKLINARFGSYSNLKLPKWIKRTYSRLTAEINKKFDVSEYRGLWYGESNKLFSIANFRFNRILWKYKYINHKIYSIKFNNNDVTHEIGDYFQKIIFEEINNENITTVGVNENFSILRTSDLFKLHKNTKIILVIRNPLDVYADSLRVGWLAMPYNIDKFIVFQNNLYKQLTKIYNSHSKCIHLIRFEDLCKNYDHELNKLKNFLPDTLIAQKNKIFDPNISIKNIDQWQRYSPWIKKYEKNFSEYKKFVNNYTKVL